MELAYRDDSYEGITRHLINTLYSIGEKHDHSLSNVLWHNTVIVLDCCAWYRQLELRICNETAQVTDPDIEGMLHALGTSLDKVTSN